MAKGKEELEEGKKVKAKTENAKKESKTNTEKNSKENEKLEKARTKMKEHNKTEAKGKETGIKDEKVNKILKKAKEQGKITYGDLAKELDDVMQSYEKERLVNRKIEIIEKLENNNETIEQEEKNKLEKELTDIIIRVAKMK